MPLYEIEDGHRLMHIQHKTFQEVDLKERQHLQALLRDNISAISPDLLIIDEEFTNWTDSNRRIDLLALDRDVNLNRKLLLQRWNLEADLMDFIHRERAIIHKPLKFVRAGNHLDSRPYELPYSY